MTQLKEIEREKRLNDALRNLRLAESKVAIKEKQIQEIKQKYDVNDIHVSAHLQNVKTELAHAQRDTNQALEVLKSVDADNETLDSAIERMNI